MWREAVSSLSPWPAVQLYFPCSSNKPRKKYVKRLLNLLKRTSEVQSHQSRSTDTEAKGISAPVILSRLLVFPCGIHPLLSQQSPWPQPCFHAHCPWGKVFGVDFPGFGKRKKIFCNDGLHFLEPPASDLLAPWAMCPVLLTMAKGSAWHARDEEQKVHVCTTGAWFGNNTC